MGVWAGRGGWRVVALVALIAGTPGCGGCGLKPPEYPPDFQFPSRADRLVLKLPDKPAPDVNHAGKRDEEIAELDRFGGGARTVDPATVPADDRSALDAFLKTTFGTPAAPVAPDEMTSAVHVTNAHLAEGARLYKRHCADCHNITGDGRGAKSGTFQVPFPRDYRQGAFKFVSSSEGGKPRRTDLLRTIQDGLKGTAMPSFALLPEGERDLLADYVMYLSIRGQVEFDALRGQIEGKPNEPGVRLKGIVAEWAAAETAPPLPAEPDDGKPDSPACQEAVRRGHNLFTEKVDNSCISCHGDYGRKPVLRYDVWGTVAKPANFTEPYLKGGTRPEDVYARIRFGIAAVGMPAHAPPKYTDRDVWDLVRFVSAAPYQVKLPEDLRSVVYPKP